MNLNLIMILEGRLFLRRKEKSDLQIMQFVEILDIRAEET